MEEEDLDIYKVIGLDIVDETMYNTDELYNCQIDEVIYASKNGCKVGGLYDFNINDITEIKDGKTGEILYRNIEQ